MPSALAGPPALTHEGDPHHVAGDLLNPPGQLRHLGIQRRLDAGIKQERLDQLSEGVSVPGLAVAADRRLASGRELSDPEFNAIGQDLGL